MRVFSRKIKIVITISIFLLFSFTTFASTSITPIEQNAINILNGNYAPYYFSKDHQVYLKANAIKNLNKRINTVIVGSSHLQSLTTEDVESECINLSIGGGTFQDKLNILGLLDYYNVKYDRVIMDFTLIELCNFKEASANANPLNSFGNYFIKVVKNKRKNKPIINFNKYYKNIDNFDLDKKLTEEELDKNEFYYRSNFSARYGNVVYSAIKNDEKELTKIIESEEKINTLHISKEAKSIVYDIIKYFNKKEIKVNLVMIPKPPAIFNKLEMYKFPLVREMTEMFIDLVVNHGCTIEGAYDPNFIGATMDDFYDYYHLYPESFKKFYRFN